MLYMYVHPSTFGKSLSSICTARGTRYLVVVLVVQVGSMIRANGISLALCTGTRCNYLQTTTNTVNGVQGTRSGKPTQQGFARVWHWAQIGGLGVSYKPSSTRFPPFYSQSSSPPDHHTNYNRHCNPSNHINILCWDASRIAFVALVLTAINRSIAGHRFNRNNILLRAATTTVEEVIIIIIMNKMMRITMPN